MRAGLNAYDADTHVNPAAEVLERYVDPAFRPRLAELAPYRVAMKSHAPDYPHSECQFPDSVDNVLRWTSLKPGTKRKLFWDNAARFFKQT